MNTDKERKTPKPLTSMAAHLSKLEYYASHAPEVPEWFLYKDHTGDRFEIIDVTPELYFQWRKYYAEQMINLFK